MLADDSQLGGTADYTMLPDSESRVSANPLAKEAHLVEPPHAADPIVADFSRSLMPLPYNFLFDTLLAIAPSLLAILGVFDDASGLKQVYFDGCSLASNATAIPLADCIACNGGSPRFAVAFKSYWRIVIIVFSIASSVLLAGATYGLSLYKFRAAAFLPHGIFISSTISRNCLSAGFVSLQVLGLSIFQLLATSDRLDDFRGVSFSCASGSAYAGLSVVPSFKSGNTTLPTSLVDPSSWRSLAYFILNTVVSQAYTIRRLFTGPANLYADSTLRDALKRPNAMRRVQEVVRYSVLARDLDAVARSALFELTVRERPRRTLSLLRIVFLPVILLDYYGTYTSAIGTHPFDSDYRKPEWSGRTLVEEVVHRLWAAGKLAPFSAAADATAEEQGVATAEVQGTGEAPPSAPTAPSAAPPARIASWRGGQGVAASVLTQ